MTTSSDKAGLARATKRVCELEGEVQRLELALKASYSAVLDMAPYDLANILDSSYGCATRQDVFRWAERAAEEIIRVAGSELLQGPPDCFGEYRMRCPLCRKETRSFDPEGFKLPDGLKRHLLGAGNCLNTQCPVFKAAMQLAFQRIAHQGALPTARSRRGRPRLPPP